MDRDARSLGSGATGAIVRDTTSIDGSAYVCAAVMPMGFARPLPAEMEIAILRDGILCFVPPDMGT